MLRKTHALPGLFAALLVMLMALSGALLALSPVLDQASLPRAEAPVSVAQLASKVSERFPDVEQLRQLPSGTLVVHYRRDGQALAERVDPQTGASLGAYAPSPFWRWVRELHRALLLGTPGHAGAALGALAMLVLSLSGAWLLARRMGGWRRLFAPLKGSLMQRWHLQVARASMPVLLLTACTGLYLAAGTFGLVDDGSGAEPPYPELQADARPAPVAELGALQTLPLAQLRELTFPSPDNPGEPYGLSTRDGEGYVDPASGQWLGFQPYNTAHQAYEWAWRLHTGEGLSWLAAVLGLAALGVPLMTLSGVQMWWRRRSDRVRLDDNHEAEDADCVVLVGSEHHSTWGFARTLAEALASAGHRVHCAPMNDLAPHYPLARQLLVLTATHGDGAAPASASRFLEHLARDGLQADLPVAVLGFGDRQFPRFCAYAEAVDAALQAQGARPLLPLERIDRQSPQAFHRWGLALGEALGHPLQLEHQPSAPASQPLELMERRVYGEQVNAPTQVLRFRAPSGSAALPAFEAGDLVGIVPPGSAMPRFYSLASGAEDGVLEICVRRHEGGLCSSLLHRLPIGGQVQAFIQPNPQFRPASGRHPVILIGAGTGIGPLTGFIRNNREQHPMHLYWGGRHPASDFLYEDELRGYLADQRLTRLCAAFSQHAERQHVQDRLLGDAPVLRQLLAQGAQVLVCGGRDMAQGVMHALDRVLAPLGLDVNHLKAQGRYREDVY
ncbi:PepSY domain-containing protein [Metapseudomonas otitidis]|uniref:PepSY domain-containing protein n=1 Tax=Metapseudomonas otitidis TaxID=319939 RepID=UPI0020979032|nr:PepSY domain-containing protein [Pseudomonas otitidis]MCO7554036.1 PepSY domain-containing protein [Pseudomonas otitidis]